MVQSVLEAPMAKKNVSPVKLPADVVESARIVSALKGDTISDLLAGILRPILSEMERDLLAKRQRAVDPPKPKGK